VLPGSFDGICLFGESYHETLVDDVLIVRVQNLRSKESNHPQSLSFVASRFNKISHWVATEIIFVATTKVYN